MSDREKTLDAEIAAMEAELAKAEEEEISFDELVDRSAAIEAEIQKEARKRAIPKLLNHARVAKLQIQRDGLLRELESWQAERDRAYDELQKAIDKDRRAKEQRKAAYGAWGVAHGAVQSIEERIKRTERDIRELKGGLKPT